MTLSNRHFTDPGNQPDTDHETLIQAWMAGDLAAFDTFFEQTYRSHFQKKASSLLRREHGVRTTLPVSDLIHHTYFKLVAHPPQTFLGMPSFWAYVRKTMKRLIIDEARKQKSLKRGGQDIQTIDLQWAIQCLDGQGGRGE